MTTLTTIAAILSFVALVMSAAFNGLKAYEAFADGKRLKEKISTLAGITLFVALAALSAHRSGWF